MRFAYFFFALTLASFILLTSAKERSTTCREPVIFQNFDMTRLLGHWYEYSRHHHDFEAGCDCLTTELVAVDANTIDVSSCCQMNGFSNVTQKCEIGIRNVRLTNPEKKEAFFEYTRTGCKYCLYLRNEVNLFLHFIAATVKSHVWIVDTDYVNYVVANGCDYVTDDDHREIFWIFSRDKEISAAEVKKIDAVLKAHNFENNKIIKQTHGVHL